MKCVLVGNYGVGNFGDEALKNYFLSSFPEIDWQVISHTPSQTEFHRLPGGIRSLFSGKWLETLKVIKKSDALVFGSGTLFTDNESVRACILWFIYAFVAHVYKVPIALAFQGIGPFHTVLGEKLARYAVRSSSFISVRDTESYERIRTWKMNTKIVQTFDPVFSAMVKEKNAERTENVFSIIPRHNSVPSLFASSQERMRAQSSTKLQIILMQPRQEKEVADRLMQQFSSDVEITSVPVYTLQDLMQAVTRSSMVISERFHGCLACLAADVSFHGVPQKPGDKIDQLTRYTSNDRSYLMHEVEKGEDALRFFLASIQ